MTIYFTATPIAFWDDRIHAVIPAEARPISAELHAALLRGQSEGKIIGVTASGLPSLVTPPPPTPAELLAAERAAMTCSRMQARVALHQAGLLEQAEAAVAAADPIVQIAWTDAAEWRRDSPTLATLAAALGLTDAQVDDLFRAAMQIVA